MEKSWESLISILMRLKLVERFPRKAFIDRAAKLLKVDLNDISMVVTDELLIRKKTNKYVEKNKRANGRFGTSAVWTEAFSSVLKRFIFMNIA